MRHYFWWVGHYFGWMGVGGKIFWVGGGEWGQAYALFDNAHLEWHQKDAFIAIFWE